MLPQSIKGKLGLVLVVAILGMVAVSIVAALFDRNTVLEDKRTKTRHLVEVATSFASHYQGMEKSGAMPPEAARGAAIAAIKALRYEGKEYFWINDLTQPTPKMIMHPTLPVLDDTVLDAAKFNCATSLQDGDAGEPITTDGKMNLFVAFNTVARRAGHGFVTYLWPKPKDGGGVTDETFPKLSYVKLYEPWGWVIGSGIYIDDLKVSGRSDFYNLSLDSKSAKIKADSVIKLKKADFRFNLVNLDGQHFFTTLRNKLMWGIDKRQ